MHFEKVYLSGMNADSDGVSIMAYISKTESGKLKQLFAIMAVF